MSRELLGGSLFLFEGGVSEGVSLRTERGEWRDFRVKGWEIPFLFLCIAGETLGPFGTGCYRFPWELSIQRGTRYREFVSQRGSSSLL